MGLKVIQIEDKIAYTGIRLYEEGGACIVDKICQEDYGRESKWEYQTLTHEQELVGMYG